MRKKDNRTLRNATAYTSKSNSNYIMVIDFNLALAIGV